MAAAYAARLERQSGTRVEAAGTLARATPTRQVPFARENHTSYQAARFLPELLFVSELTLRRVAATRLPYQPGHLCSAACPRFGARAITAPSIGSQIRTPAPLRPLPQFQAPALLRPLPRPRIHPGQPIFSS